MSGNPEVTVYEHPLSPYAQKVKIALLEKNVEFAALVPPWLGDPGRDDYVTLNPRGEVPLLVHRHSSGPGRENAAGDEAGDVVVFDSSIILQYIEEQWPQPALLPESAAQCARLRMLEDVMDTHFEGNTWGLSEVQHFGRASGALAERLQGFAEQQIRQWFVWLERQLDDADWFNGASFGWGDLCVVPFVNGACRFDILPAPDTKLAVWLERANERDSVAVCRRAAQAAELDAEQMQAALRQGFKREYRDHRLEWMVRAGGMSIVEDGLAAGNIRFTEAF